MNGINIKKWAKASVATLWPNLFRWSHWPIVIRRRSAAPRSVLLGRDMYLESRESPTTIWRLDPIVAAAISSGMMGQLIHQLPTLQREGEGGRGRVGDAGKGRGSEGESRSSRQTLSAVVGPTDGTWSAPITA